MSMNFCADGYIPTYRTLYAKLRHESKPPMYKHGWHCWYFRHKEKIGIYSNLPYIKLLADAVDTNLISMAMQVLLYCAGIRTISRSYLGDIMGPSRAP